MGRFLTSDQNKARTREVFSGNDKGAMNWIGTGINGSKRGRIRGYDRVPDSDRRFRLQEKGKECEQTVGPMHRHVTDQTVQALWDHHNTPIEPTR